MKTRRRILLLIAVALLGIAGMGAFEWMREAPRDRAEAVVLLHGMGRSRA